MALYLGRPRSERLLEELINELQTIETMSCLIERMETPPFFRVTSLRKTSSHWGESEPVAPQSVNRSDQDGAAAATAAGTALAVEKGTIHTKRHSSEDPALLATSAASSSTGKASPRLDRSRSQHDEIVTKKVCLEEHPVIISGNTYEVCQPHPLPMPEYGGYFAPLTEFLPDSSQPVSGFHRCNLAVMFLVDLVVESMEHGNVDDWAIHLPLVLHMATLGLDHARPLVSEHCKQLMLNLLLVMAEHGDHLAGTISFYWMCSSLFLALFSLNGIDQYFGKSTLFVRVLDVPNKTSSNNVMFTLG